MPFNTRFETIPSLSAVSVAKEEITSSFNTELDFSESNATIAELARFAFLLEILSTIALRSFLSLLSVDFLYSLSVVSHSRDNVQGLTYDSIAAASLRRSFRVPRTRLGVGCES